MKQYILSFKNLLDEVFITINKQAGILADCYLLKDVSIISKWKNNRVTPKSEDILKIVEFASKESTEAQRKILRNRIELIINNSSLNQDIINSLIAITDFNQFLFEVFNLVVSLNAKQSNATDSIDGKSISVDLKLGDNLPFDTGMPEGKYSGIVEFNMVISKEKSSQSVVMGENQPKMFLDIKRIRNGIKRRLSARSLLGTIIIGIISSFIVFKIVNAAQVPEQKAVSSYEATNRSNAEKSSMSQEDNKIRSADNKKPQSNVILPPKNINPSTGNTVKDFNHSRESTEETPTGSNDTTVKGNHNIIVNGSNISIHVN